MPLLNINENQALFNDALSTTLKFVADPDPEFTEAILANNEISSLTLPFDLVKGSLQAEAKGGKEIIQLKSDAELTIDGKASAQLRVGIYDEQKDLEAALEVQEEDMHVELPVVGNDEVFVIFVMGYEFSGEGNAGLPFSGGSVKVGLQGSKQRRQAVIRRFKKDAPLRTALVSTFASIRSVKDIREPQVAGTDKAAKNQLADKTTILFNREGSTGATIDVSAGYDFNWAYTSKLDHLEGELGLKAKLGAAIGVDFTAAGSLTMALTNVGEDKIRLQSFKQKDRNFDFSAKLDASVQGELSDELKQKTVDDILKAVLGTHHEQVFRDLKKIEDALNPEEIKEKVKGFSEVLLNKVTTGRLGEKFEDKRQELLDLIGKWEKLGSEAGAEIWKLLDEQFEKPIKIGLSNVKKEVNTLAELDEDGLKKELKSLFEDTGFLESELGKLVSTLVPDKDLVDALVSDQLLKTVMDKLDDLNALMSIENHVIKLHSVITEKLSIDKIKKAVEDKNLDNISDWLLARVDEALDSKQVESALKVLKEVDKFVDGIRSKSDEFLEATKEAITKEYSASLSYNLQKSSEKSALVDATFSFDQNDDAMVRKVFDEVIKGDLGSVLKKSTKGISLNRGVLTSKAKRRASLSLTLPFMQRDFVHLNEAMVENEFLQTEDGRLSMFTLKAKDQRLRTHRMSEVTVDLIYHKLLKQNADRVEKESWDMNYNFKLARKKFKKRDLEQIMKPFVALYLGESFEDQTYGLTVEQWIDDLEKLVESNSDDNDNKRRFGNVLLKLGLIIPSDAGRAWLNAPADKEDPKYVELAKALQSRLKALIPMYFLLDDRFYNRKHVRETLYAILIYKNLAPFNMLKKINRKDKIRTFVNEATTKIVPRLLINARFKDRMKRDMANLRRSLLDNDDEKMRSFVVNIDDANLERVYREFRSSNSSKVQNDLRRLYELEDSILRMLIEAGSDLGEFSESSGSDSEVKPADVVATLEGFGSKITNAVNSVDIALIANNKDYTRYLGVDIFNTVAKVFDADLDEKSKGLIQLIALNDDATFDYETYLTGEDPTEKDILFSRLIHS